MQNGPGTPNIGCFDVIDDTPILRRPISFKYTKLADHWFDQAGDLFSADLGCRVPKSRSADRIGTMTIERGALNLTHRTRFNSFIREALGNSIAGLHARVRNPFLNDQTV